MTFYQAPATPFRTKPGIMRSVDLTPDKDSASIGGDTIGTSMSDSGAALRYASPATPKRCLPDLGIRSPPATPKRSKVDQRAVSSSLDSGLARLLSSGNQHRHTETTPRRHSWRRCRDYGDTPVAPRKSKHFNSENQDLSPIKPRALFSDQEATCTLETVSLRLLSSFTALVGFLCTFVASSLTYDGNAEVSITSFAHYLGSNSVQFRSQHLCTQALLKMARIFPRFAQLAQDGHSLVIKESEAASVLQELRRLRVAQVIGSAQ